MPKLSAVIIANNEERDIGRCLDSLAPVSDEILVVDSYSTDRTREICESKGVRFEQHEFEGYIQQKNFAMKLASHDYIISLDADEALSGDLQKSILEIKNSWQEDGYYIRRLNYYCGKWLRHGGWYPDKKLRLWKKDQGKWGGLNPHDHLELIDASKTGTLKGNILHYTYYTVKEHMDQVNYFTDISSQQYFKIGRRSNLFLITLGPILKFLRDYVLKLGFLDGYYGFVAANISAHGNYLKYLKLKRLQDNS